LYLTFLDITIIDFESKLPQTTQALFGEFTCRTRVDEAPDSLTLKEGKIVIDAYSTSNLIFFVPA